MKTTPNPKYLEEIQALRDAGKTFMGKARHTRPGDRIRVAGYQGADGFALVTEVGKAILATFEDGAALRLKPTDEVVIDPRDFIDCLRCGRFVLRATTRLMFGQGGTYRRCGGLYERKCLRLVPLKETK